jgi:DNA-binding CsgD family transcriptional regulator/tetratricopeptide (TPR) repeat protein
VSRRICSPELIGRAAEVAALGAALADARSGRGRLVLVEGDAGIGKTRLVEDFAAQVDGVRVLAGGGVPLASDAPYAPVLGILQALARLYPPAAGGLLPPDAPGRADPFGPTRLFAAAADAIRAVAAGTSLVLVVEDLHWADASTCGLVSFLAREIRADPVLLLVTVRAEELDPARPVSVLIGELARMPHAERLVLAPLDRAGVAALVEAITGVAPSARLTGRLVQRAAGNPFFTEELLAAGPDALTLPPSVGDVLAARVARLPAAGQRVLDAASVLGRAVPHRLLAAVAEATDLDDGLAAAVSHRLLEPRGDGYRFRHPLIQETVCGRLLPPARQALHARAAAALAELRPPAGPAGRAGHAVQVAFHWQQAGQAANALAAAVYAGDLAQAARAPAEALAQYTIAIEEWETLPDPQAAVGVDEISLLERAAEAASGAGDNARAKELAQRVLVGWDLAADPVRAALRLERLGRFSWLAGDLAASRQAYEDALRVIPDQPSAARARVLAATAQSLMLRSLYLSSRGYAEQAVAAAQAVGARAEEAHARNTLGTDLAALGCHAGGIEMIRAGLRIARQIGDDIEAARCQVNLATSLAEARLATGAVRAGEEGILETTSLGLGRGHAAAILGSVLEALYQLGRWDEIQARVTAALDDEPEPWPAVAVLIPRCRVALARGDLTVAAADLAAMTAVPGAVGDAYYGADLAALEATLAAARGDQALATARVGDALTIAASTDDLARHLSLAALAVRIEADTLDSARLTGHRADPPATRARAERILATAHDAMTRIAGAGGCASPVFSLLETLAAAELSRIPGPADPGLWHQAAASELAGPYLAGYARLQQAAGLLARRRRREATAALRDAENAARLVAAAPMRAEITALARRARIDLAAPAPMPPPDPDPACLTPREREVITLLSNGLSNAEIARTLYISEKTASVHVSNILRKLGVTSRLQAAAAAHSHHAPTMPRRTKSP